MADYLQPGGARMKLSKEEKQTFLFKVKNLSKSVIAQSLIDTLNSADNSVVLVQFAHLTCYHRNQYISWKLS